MPFPPPAGSSLTECAVPRGRHNVDGDVLKS
jgi:hypothetical protein